MYNMSIIIRQELHLSLSTVVPDASITPFWPNLGRSRQLSDLVQKRLTLTGPVLQDLIPKVINLLTRSSRRVALFEFLVSKSFHENKAILSWRGEGNHATYLSGLDPADLHGQEELGHLNGKTAADAAQTRLSSQVRVELVLQGGQVGGGRVRGRGEGVEGELERARARLGEVDLAERRGAGRHVGDVVDGRAGPARHGRLDRRDRVLHLGRERVFADHEAGVLAGLEGRCGRGCQSILNPIQA